MATVYFDTDHYSSPLKQQATDSIQGEESIA